MDNAVRLAILVLSAVLSACMARQADVEPPVTQVLFVCEHGNVKSLMAALYFNEMVRARDLPFRAVSRGTAPDSNTVPDFVKAPLTSEGFDVSGFRPRAITRDDLAESEYVISISTTLSVDDSAATTNIEEWNDIPAASTDYDRARDSIKAHIADLVQRLESERDR
jgi:arsenate reductase (thioredoxin)